MIITLLLTTISCLLNASRAGMSNGDSFYSWVTSESTIPIANHAMNVEYNETLNKDCIWVFGGSDDPTSFYCYNITSDIIYTYGTLQNLCGGESSSIISSALINEIFYYANIDGNICRYNITSNSELSIISSIGLSKPCMVKHPNNKYLYIIQGDGTGT